VAIAVPSAAFDAGMPASAGMYDTAPAMRPSTGVPPNSFAVL
jgi:hypothetical protein